MDIICPSCPFPFGYSVLHRFTASDYLFGKQDKHSQYN